MAQLLTSIVYRSTKADGTVNALGKVQTYLAGTLTPAATYTTAAGDVANENPVPLGADGTAQIWLDPALSYRFIELDRNNAPIPGRDVDGISSPASVSAEDLASTASGKGAALVGYNPAVSYAAATVGFELNKRKSVFGTGVAATDVANINAAIAAAEPNTIVEFFGNFVTNASIVVKPQIWLLANGAKFTHTNSAADFISYTPGRPAGFPGKIVVEGFEVVGPGNTGTANFVKIDANAPYCLIRKCFVGQFFGAVYLRDAYGSVIDQCAFYNFSHGIRLLREAHEIDIRATLIDGCTIACVSVNYGGGAGTGPLHNVNIYGGALQNSAVGVWAENCLELHTVGVYHEGNSVNDYRIGVADAGAYERACYSVVIDGFSSASPCASDRNVRIEHSVGVQIRSAAWNSGCSTTATLASYDGFSDRVIFDIQRYSTLTPTATAPLDFSVDPTRGVVMYRGRPIFGTGQTDAIQFGGLATQLAKVYQQQMGGRETLMLQSAQDVRVRGAGVFRLDNSAGNPIASFDLSGSSLPSSAGGAGSKTIWYDPADGNRLKYTP